MGYYNELSIDLGLAYRTPAPPRESKVIAEATRLSDKALVVLHDTGITVVTEAVRRIPWPCEVTFRDILAGVA